MIRSCTELLALSHFRWWLEVVCCHGELNVTDVSCEYGVLGLSALVIDDVQDAGEVICVRARTRDQAVACPGCGTATTRVHGYHERTAADVPVDGRRVLVRGPGPPDALPGPGLPAADLP